MPQAAHIFVSHNAQDALWCHDFVAGLRATEANVWYDEHNLGYGQLMTEIERELRARPIFIVVLSPSAVASKWVQREVNAAIDLADHDPQRIILPVVAEKCDIPLFWRGFKRITGPDDGGVTAQEAAGRVIRALALAPAAAAVAPAPSPAARAETKEDAVERGNGLHAQKRYAEALAAYDRALALDPQWALAWTNKGATLNGLGRNDEALAASDRALALDPQDAFAWNDKGNALRALRRFDEALAAYDRALALDPQFAIAWHGKGNALSDLRRFDETLAAYDRALALDPKFAFAWNGKIELLKWLGRTAEALAAERKRDAALQAK